ncbi:MAG TPA: hypothetical protein VFD20_06470 [Demequina sp.]|nr:hypothetical protein [Demequina sp.]
MDAETANNLITAAAALGGALVGGLATVLATTLQQRHEREAELTREERAEKRRRRQATEERERLAAGRCDSLVTQLTGILSNNDRATDVGPYFHAQVSPVLQELSSESVFLPKALRERVDEAALVILQAEDLGREHYHGEIGWAAHTVHHDIHNAVAAWLRGDELPDRSDNMCDFILAAERVNSFHQEQYDEYEGHELEGLQGAWRQNNAEELAGVKKRGQAPD